MTRQSAIKCNEVIIPTFCSIRITYLITGGAQSIGEAIVRKLASGGAAIAILDIQHEKAQQVVDDIKSEGGSAIAVGMDITDSQNVRQAVEEVERRFGKVDILVNNVGWDKAAPFIEYPSLTKTVDQPTMSTIKSVADTDDTQKVVV